MANTINDLYQKYTNKVGRTLENDRYFQYLYAMVEASQNTFLHQHQVLHKVVDEQWLSIIEDTLDDINTIIEKPRRFVTTKEEVVPVALAKKITADSVRHLSMNTQFIASDENGEIQPTRILNVSTEESFDLYENRFIYHLIQRLVTFIDKRTDIIFWSTGDETSDRMVMESQVDDAYETITYKLEMTVKNNQSVIENDTDNMSVFMRIDHVRRLVMALRNSSFCSLMAGCSKVRSPIQRTNLMMKDPHYRKCYQLWQFLESYDDVGYTIDVQQTPMEFDEEYLIQMYTNLITNYTVFKSLLEGDARNIAELMPKKHRIIKPKFIKKIQEEIVNDRNIEDVEIRKVFLEEVTEAQLIAEARVEELTAQLAEREAEKAELEEELDSAQVSAQKTMMQLSEVMQQQMELAAELEEEKETRLNAEAELEQLTQDAEAALAEAEAATAAVEEEKAAVQEELEKARADAEAMSAEKDAAFASMVAEKDAKCEALAAEKDAAYEAMAAEKDAAFEAMKSEKEAEYADMEAKRNAAYAAMVAEKDSVYSAMVSEKDAAFTAMVSEKDAAYQDMVEKKDAAYAEMVREKDAAYARMAEDKDAVCVALVAETEETAKREADEKIAAEREQAEKAIEEIREKAAGEIAEAHDRAVQASTKLQTVMTEREMAEQSYQAELEALKLEKEEALAKLLAEKEEEIARLQAEHSETLQKLQSEKDSVDEKLAKEMEKVEKEAAARIKAEEKYAKLKNQRSIFRRRRSVKEDEEK